MRVSKKCSRKSGKRYSLRKSLSRSAGKVRRTLRRRGSRSAGRGSRKRMSPRRGRGRGRGRRRRGRGKRSYSRRVMRGGSLEYSPLPCYPEGTMLPVPNTPGVTYNASGHTNFDSTKQVGHETCVEYGTEGAEPNDMKKLGDMDITDTIKDAVDAELARRAASVNNLTRSSMDVSGASNEKAAEAARIAATRQAQQAAANADAAAS
jgi:hypothetical protein